MRTRYRPTKLRPLGFFDRFSDLEVKVNGETVYKRYGNIYHKKVCNIHPSKDIVKKSYLYETKMKKEFDEFLSREW